MRIIYPYESKYHESDTEVIGIITHIQEKKEYTSYEIKAKEKLLATSSKENTFHLGDQVRIKGSFQKPSKNKTKYLFNYQEYLKQKRIFWIIRVEEIECIHKNKKIGYKIKQFIQKRLNQNPYLYTFILGDKSLLSKDVMRSYQENGISHLFAISGMHITLLASILQKGLKKFLSEEKRYKTISLFLLFYLLLVGPSSSVVRGVLFYILFEGNKVYYFYIKKENLFLLALSISLFINPFGIYDIGFQYSYSISYALLKMSEQLSSPNKITSLLKVSLVAFLVSIPITLKNYYQMNFLSILYNLFYVPFVSIIVFPLSLLTVLFPFLSILYQPITMLLEKSSLFLSQISLGKLLWIRLPDIIYYIYFIFIIIFVHTKKKKILYGVLILLLIHFLIPYFDSTKKVIALDVGQGDSTVAIINHKAILIDTGGNIGDEKGNLFHNTIYPILKMNGIKTIQTLILTHGDYDHMGEASTVVKEVKVKQVVFNCGGENNLEKELILELEKKKIPYDSCIDSFTIHNNKFYFLKTKEYDNENDNSNVIYLELEGYHFLFMGDASITTEKEILNQYDLPTIDVLKVGHHGAKTSSGKEFIEEISPTYSIISVGENNKYGHPNKEVLEHLKDSEIFRTDIHGSITFKMKNNQLKIESNSS